MNIYAHRGNLVGPNPDKENHPDYIKAALRQGFGVEIDIRIYGDDRIWLGHDLPQYQVKHYTILDWLDFGPVILDCKNYEAMIYCSNNFVSPRADAYYYSDKHPVFSHRGRLVIPPQYPTLKQRPYSAIYVMPEQSPYDPPNNEFYGMVTDQPVDYLVKYRREERGGR